LAAGAAVALAGLATALAPAPSMRATTSPTCTVAPSLATIVITPALGAGISTLALSVSSSKSGSSAATCSPFCFSQRTMTPSLMDSPRVGI
jgi:hypothetical protein